MADAKKDDKKKTDDADKKKPDGASLPSTPVKGETDSMPKKATEVKPAATAKGSTAAGKTEKPTTGAAGKDSGSKKSDPKPKASEGKTEAGTKAPEKPPEGADKEKSAGKTEEAKPKTETPAEKPKTEGGGEPKEPSKEELAVGTTASKKSKGPQPVAKAHDDSKDVSKGSKSSCELCNEQEEGKDGVGSAAAGRDAAASPIHVSATKPASKIHHSPFGVPVVIAGRDHAKSRMDREQRRSAKLLLWSALLGISALLFLYTSSASHHSHDDSQAVGNLGPSGKMLDYGLFFLMLFFLFKFLTTTAAVTIITSVAAFHYFERIHYRSRPPIGVQGLHLRYFLLMFLGCLATLHVLALWKQHTSPEEDEDALPAEVEHVEHHSPKMAASSQAFSVPPSSKKKSTLGASKG